MQNQDEELTPEQLERMHAFRAQQDLKAIEEYVSRRDLRELLKKLRMGITGTMEVTVCQSNWCQHVTET